ncbi:MAG: translation initiation factor [Chloroflexi bacterium]|nr:translation initiation factor [Chloroflexota bacterium]
MPTLQTPKTVWSSEDGDLRKQDEKPAIVNSLPPQQQTIYLHRESKGRGGKGVTLIKGLILAEADMSALAKKLKQACGSGGTVKDGVIEIQGENREKIADILRKLGCKVKVAGG